MNEDRKLRDGGKVPFETALDMAGFGMYSYILISLAGFIIIAYACIGFSTTVIIPASACELNTTNAQQGYIAAGPLVGVILGGVVGGYLGDKFGRRKTLLITLVSSAVINAIASISVNWVMLMLVQSIASFCSAGQFSLSMTILSESVPMGKRNLVVLLVTSIFLSAQGLMAVIAIPIIPLPFSFYLSGIGIYWNSWRTLMLVYSTPSLIAALWLFFMKESPKFVSAQGREYEAVEIIKTIHRLNKGKSAGDLQITGLIMDTQESKGPSSPKDQIFPLFKMPLLKYTLIITGLFLFQQVGAFLIWLPTIANEFVKIVETGQGTDQSLCAIITEGFEAPPNPDIAPCAVNELALLIVFVVGLTKSVVNVLLSLIVNKTGRRNMVMCVAVICGVAGIIVNLIPNAYGSIVFFIIFMLGIVVMGLYTAIAVALFPTQLRALAVALTMTGGRLGTFASVQILNLLLTTNCDAGFYIFSSIFASSAILAALLPDDRRLQKPQQQPEARDIDKPEDRMTSIDRLVGAFLIWLPTIANEFVKIVETGQGTDQSLCAIITEGFEAPPNPDIAPCAVNELALLIVFVVGLTKSVVNVLLSLIVNKTGRRNMVMCVAVICGVAGIIVNLIPNAYGSIVFFIIFMLGIVVMGIYTAIAVALFPTQLRALAVALTMTGGRLGTFASVQILNLLLTTNCDAGFYIFSSIFASSAILAALLPDDRRLQKPQQQPEARDIDKPEDRMTSIDRL